MCEFITMENFKLCMIYVTAYRIKKKNKNVCVKVETIYFISVLDIGACETSGAVLQVSNKDM